MTKVSKGVLATFLISIPLTACDEAQSIPELEERDALLADVGLSDDELPDGLAGLSTSEMAAEFGVEEENLPEQLEGFVRTRADLLDTLGMTYDEVDPSLRNLPLPELAQALDPDGTALEPDAPIEQDLTAATSDTRRIPPYVPPCVYSYDHFWGSYKVYNSCGYGIRAKVIIDRAPDTTCMYFGPYQDSRFWTWGSVSHVVAC